MSRCIAVPNERGEIDPRLGAVHDVASYGRIDPLGRRNQIVPPWMQTPVYDHEVVLDTHHRLGTHPVQQWLRIGCVEHSLQQVIAWHRDAAGSDLQQKEIVVAEYDPRVDRTQESQHTERIRTPVDQVADTVQAVTGAESDAIEKAFQDLPTALDVTDADPSSFSVPHFRSHLFCRNRAC